METSASAKPSPTASNHEITSSVQARAERERRDHESLVHYLEAGVVFDVMPASFRRQDYSSANHHVQYGAEQASRRVAARASGIVNESTRVF